MKSEEKIEIDTTGWIWRVSESESERGLFCPRDGEPIPLYVSNRIGPESAGSRQVTCSRCGEAIPAMIDEEVRNEE